jgi:hypothetical protein
MNTIEELAKDAFQKREYVNALGMANTPIDYLERQKAFIELAKAQEAARIAELKLKDRIEKP